MDRKLTIPSKFNIQKNNQPFSKKDIGSRGALIQWVKESGLSVRATNVILANVNSLKKLNSLDEETLFSLPNCGRKTIHEILSFINVIRNQGKIQASVSIGELLSAPPSESSVALLPIFSNDHLKDIPIENLHPGFHTSIKIKDILLSHRTSNALNTSGMVTIGEVMFTPGIELLAWKNLGKKSFNELKRVVRSICLTGNYMPHNPGNKSISIDYTSYENMVSSFTEGCLKKKRDRELFQKKLCFTAGKTPTLEELGRPFGITRERVRQIINKGFRKFSHKANISKLEHFWERLDSVVTGGGGIIHLGALPAALQDEFNWSTAPYSLALGQFLAFRQSRKASSKIKGDSDLIMEDCECLSCDQALKQLHDFDFSTHASFHLEVLGVSSVGVVKHIALGSDPLKNFTRHLLKD